MRSRHGRATGSRITTVARIVARTCACARSSNIRLCTIASISRDRTAAAKASDGIRSGSQRADRIGCRVNSRRICHRGTTRPGVLRRCHHHDTSSFLSFNSGLQFQAGYATLRDRATPGVDRNVRRFGRVAFVGRAVQRIRREEKFHALDVPCRRAVALVHVAAANPFCAGRHSDLIRAAIVANCGAGRVRAVKEIVTRLLRVVPARIAHAVMNRIVPVKIVIRIDSVPPAVMRLQRVMRPANTGIRAGNHDSFPFESERPHIRRVYVRNARLNRCRSARCAGNQRRLLDRTSLRKIIVDNWIACHARHVGTGRQRLGKLAVSFHQNCINDIERLILDVSFAQPLKDWPLGALGLFQQGLINEPALFGFSRQIGCRTQVGLIR